MSRWMRKGSLAVEASFVMPFLVLIVFVCICLGLYLHDRSVLASCAAEMAGKGAAQKYQTEEALEIRLTEQAQALAAERLLVCRELKTEVEVTGQSVTVCYTGYTPLLSGLEFREEETAKRLNPARFLRKSRKWKELLEKG